MICFPKSDNSFSNGGVSLVGKYATVSIHPKAIEQFKNLGFIPGHSTDFVGEESDNPVKPGEDRMIPSGARLGKPIASPQEAWKRSARRLPDHDPEAYLNDGFDEIQVYWAMNRFMDSMRPLGFSDPELSERPFHAVIYNPDLIRRDFTYYSHDTVNLAFYSPKEHNSARNNPEIWHEMGEGVLDRLMGDHVELKDGGCTEKGISDFIAYLVLQDATEGKPFPGKDALRISNSTLFGMTNEAHDDGEACGGAMREFLEQAIAKYGRKGFSMGGGSHVGDDASLAEPP